MLKTVRKGEWIHLIIPMEWNGKTLEEVFRQIWEAPKKLTHTFRMENRILLDGVRVNWTLPLHSGEVLQMRLFTEEPLSVIPHFHDIDVLYEDDHVIVINKPPFMNTHPNDTNEDHTTLTNALAFYLQAKGENRNIRQVHRLDRDTSGAILFAKHALAGAILDKMLEKREIKRTYIAAVNGVFNQKKGRINAPIGKDRHHATRRRVSNTGQEAITNYHVLFEDKHKQISIVKCWLETGRTHQIRVHLSHTGHPIIGDILYGGEKKINRQALHAAKLEFHHPITQEKITCHAPVLDLQELFKQIDVYTL
ncbi:23S rRNA pseudouridine1911/1915/1917 synthase [Bacillus sp. SORGH_AS 510]|uniref:RluA family pseudouridine synthase n=1 Tax=Bacillus sp. SORGH_AS_0510 TaxID=3041771 RepID=UPI002788939F|nr:RluA family pseudouridine synthase [Bacillus sp. SORGH_AS_0510]MDQ1147268.1 23S rRNA pseudouridine1911/1915/1917 synthase [Bacillus sp. SORGH_AS_0510]